MQRQSSHLLSVIIVAHNQHAFLECLLTAVGLSRSQQRLEDRLEIIVVDIGSAPALRGTISLPPPLFEPIWCRLEPGDLAFQPGAGRNLGLTHASGTSVLFLDGDCIPGSLCLESHLQFLNSADQPVITLGHRIFVDGFSITPETLYAGSDPAVIPMVESASNYSLSFDRRLPELKSLETHSMPCNTCHGCNMGVTPLSLVRALGFAPAFDGYWGYEDVELGYRLVQAGARIHYLPDAFVYHLEGGGLPETKRREDRKRNFRLACELIPGFAEFRARCGANFYSETHSEDLGPGKA